MADLLRFESSMLIEKPLELFVSVHESLRPMYDQVSNRIYTSAEARRHFDFLAGETLVHLDRIHASPSSSENRSRLETFMEQHTGGTPEEYGVLCLATLKALGKYLSLYHKEALKRLRCLRTSGITITARPPNLIHKSTSHPVRPGVGTGMRDVLHDVYELISIIRPSTPRIELLKSEALTRTNRYFERRLRKGFRMAVSPFLRTMEFEVNSLIDSWPSHEATPYWFARVRSSDAETGLIRILEECMEKNIALLVLPELTVDEALLGAARKWLRTNNRDRVAKEDKGLLMVVAGSFHRGKNEEALYNISSVLSHGGDILWTHSKLKRYALNPVDDAHAFTCFRALCKTSAAGGHERIVVGDELVCVDTPLGRIAVCICIDFFHEDNWEAFRNSGANLFLVPAMTPAVTRFLETARALGGANLASSLVANSRTAVAPAKGAISSREAGFIYVPDTKRSLSHAVDASEELLIYEVGVNG